MGALEILFIIIIIINEITLSFDQASKHLPARFHGADVGKTNDSRFSTYCNLSFPCIFCFSSTFRNTLSGSSSSNVNFKNAKYHKIKPVAKSWVKKQQKNMCLIWVWRYLFQIFQEIPTSSLETNYLEGPHLQVFIFKSKDS